MISSRIFAQAQAMEALGESTANIPIEMRKAEKALTSVNVSIRDASDPSKLRGLEEVLDELAEKWDKLSASTKNYVAEGVAGTERRNYFISVMENYGRVLELTNEGLNSQGELAKANAVRVQSLASQVNIMKDKLMALMEGLDPVLYTGVQLGNAILDVVTAFGAIPSSVSLATVAFLSFNKSGQLVRDGIFKVAEGYHPLIANSNKYIASMNAEKAKLAELITQKKLDISSTSAQIIAKEKVGASTVALNTKLKLEQSQLKATQIQLALTTAKTVALQAVMSAGLSLAIGAVVGGLTSLISGLSNSSKNMEDLTAKTKELQEAMRVDNSNLLSEYERLGKLAQDETKTAKEKLYYNEEIAKIKAQLIESNGEYATILNDETKSLETQLNLIKAQNEERKKERARDLDKELGSDLGHNIKVNKIEENLENQYEALLKYKEVYDQIKGSDVETVINPMTGYEQSVDQFLANFKTLQDAFKETYTEADRLNGSVKTIGDAGEETGKKLIGVTDGITNMFNSLGKNSNDAIGASVEELATTYRTIEEVTLGLRTTFQGLSDSQLSYVKVFEEVRTAIQEVGGEAGAQEEVVRQFLDIFPRYEGVVKNTNDVLKIMGNEATLELGKAQAQAKDFLKSMQDMDNYTPDFAEQLMEAYPELALHIQDTAYVQEFLNNKISEMDNLYGAVMSQVDVHRTAQEEILANDADFWNQKMKNSENFLQYQSTIESKLISMGANSLGVQYDDFASFVESKGGLRDVDYSKATTLAEAESMTEAQKLNSMLKKYAQYVNEKDGYRGAESKLILDFLDWQGDTEALTINELRQMWAEFYAQRTQKLKEDIATLTKFDETLHSYGEYDTSAYKSAIELKKLNELNKQLTSGTTLFDGVKTTFKGAGTTYKGGSLGSSGLNSSGLNTNPKDKESKKKEVEDLQLVIDRYYEFNDALDDVNNALKLNRQLQASATDVSTTKKLHEEEIRLLNEKLEAMKKLQSEQRNDLLSQKNILSNAGFKFDADGNLKNYSSRLKELQNYANSLTGDAKKAQIEYVQSIVSVIDAYTTLTNDTLPSTELAIEQLGKEIKDVNKEHERTLKLIEALGDRYYEIKGLINDVDKALALNQAKQDNANATERVKLMKEEVSLMRQKQKLLMQQSSELKVEADELAKKLSEKGVKFNADGTVANYKKLIEQMTLVANRYVGDARDEKIEEAEELIGLIEQYDDIIRNTLPDLATEWEEYATSVREAEKAMEKQITEVQKNISSAIENELTKRTEKVKTELQKQKDLYNAQYEQEDWDKSLATEQRKLDEIKQQMSDLSRDTSLAGQLKLQQLREEFEAQQQVIDDMIRDKEKENGNARFDEEMEKLDQELEDALDPKNMADLVNKALVDGFVTIGDEVVALNSLMGNWLDETGDGLYAIGSSLKGELIENLRVAKGLMEDMGLISANSKLSDADTWGLTSLTSAQENQLRLMQSADAIQAKTKTSAIIQLDSLLTVQGNVTEDILPKIEEMIESAKTDVFDNIAKQMISR